MVKSGLLTRCRFTHGFGADSSLPECEDGTYADELVVVNGNVVTAKPQTYLEFSAELFFAIGLRASWMVERLRESGELTDDSRNDEIQAVKPRYCALGSSLWRRILVEPTPRRLPAALRLGATKVSAYMSQADRALRGLDGRTHALPGAGFAQFVRTFLQHQPEIVHLNPAREPVAFRSVDDVRHPTRDVRGDPSSWTACADAFKMMRNEAIRQLWMLRIEAHLDR